MYSIFRLTQMQIEGLRKYKSELEIERNVNWHERQIVSSEIFKKTLVDAGFEEGKDLSLGELRELSEQQQGFQRAVETERSATASSNSQEKAKTRR